MSNDDETRLSVSALNQYLKCGEKYRRRYLEKDWRPFGLSAHVGTAAHEVARAQHRKQMEAKTKAGLADLSRKDLIDTHRASDLVALDEVLHDAPMTMEEASDLAATKFEEAVGEKGVDFNEEEKANPEAAMGDAKDAAIAHSRFYAANIGRSMNPIGIEKKIEVRPTGTPIVLSGIVDLIDGSEVGDEIVDRKTASKQPQEGKQHGNLQLSFYASLRLAETKKLPPRFRLEYTVRTPKRKEMSRATHTTTRTMQDVKELLGRVSEAAKGIRAGVFMPADPEQWWCTAKFCEFFGDCKFTVGRRSHTE